MSENESSYGWWIPTIIGTEKEKKLYERRNIKYPGDIDTKIESKIKESNKSV